MSNIEIIRYINYNVSNKNYSCRLGNQVFPKKLVNPTTVFLLLVRIINAPMNFSLYFTHIFSCR